MVKPLPVKIGLPLLMAGLVLIAGLAGGDPTPEPAQSGAQLYRAACLSCHGPDGTGQPKAVVGFENELPDFSDCSFASREADGDWGAVVVNGGPARGFHRMMPSFAKALTHKQVVRVLDHVRTFCDKRDSWPRGELNLPRPIFTAKAFPEDEVVLTLGADTRGDYKLQTQLIVETRLGTRGQVEAVLPFVFRDQGAEGWTGGVGDLVLATKWTVLHSLRTGSILSAGAELILPTGDRLRGLGKGLWVIEPFLAFGQALPLDGFVQLHAGMELSTDTDMQPHEVFWRAALGLSLFQGGGHGRAWIPMVEVLGASALVFGASEPHWDVVPQLQITLPARQHVRLSLGVKLPINDFADRPKVVLMALLWDWFDGPFHEGW